MTKEQAETILRLTRNEIVEISGDLKNKKYANPNETWSDIAKKDLKHLIQIQSICINVIDR